jgi:hypothetical protein
MERLSDQIGQLWGSSASCRRSFPDAPRRLQELVAAINTKAGELDRATREVLI